MHTALLAVLSVVMVGCGSRTGLEVTPAPTRIECTMYWTTFGTEEFAAEVAQYDGRDAKVILAFYRNLPSGEGDSDITAPLEVFEVVDAEDTGIRNPFGLQEYHTTFAIEFADAVVDPGVRTFFDADGEQALAEGEDVYLHFVAPAGMPLSTSMMVSAAGWEADTGTCSLVGD